MAGKSHGLLKQAISVRWVQESRRKPFRQAAIGNAFASFVSPTEKARRQLIYPAIALHSRTDTIAVTMLLNKMYNFFYRER